MELSRVMVIYIAYDLVRLTISNSLDSGGEMYPKSQEDNDNQHKEHLGR